MKNIVSYSFVGVLAALQMTACGGSLKLGKVDEETSKQQIEASKSLVEFMDANPDVAKSSLKTIRTAADGGDARSSLSVSKNLPVYAKALPKAGEAVVLIDNVVEQFKFKSIFDAAVRLVAVAIKFPKEAEALFEGMAGGAPDDKGAMHGTAVGSDKNKGAGIKLALARAFSAKPAASVGASEGHDGHEHHDHEGHGEAQMADFGMTCQEIMDDPSKFIDKASGGEVSDKQVEDAMANGEKILKEVVKSCDAIDGGEFAKCTDIVIGAIANLNTKLNCEISNFKEVETIVGKSVKDLEKAMVPCYKAFKKCNFDLEHMMGDGEVEGEGGFGGHGHSVGVAPESDGEGFGAASAEPMKKSGAPKKK